VPLLPPVPLLEEAELALLLLEVTLAACEPPVELDDLASVDPPPPHPAPAARSAPNAAQPRDHEAR
jgi:hypothetical protein